MKKKYTKEEIDDYIENTGEHPEFWNGYDCAHAEKYLAEIKNSINDYSRDIVLQFSKEQIEVLILKIGQYGREQ